MKEHALLYLGESKEHQEEIITLLKRYEFDYTLLDDCDLTTSMLDLFNKKNDTDGKNDAYSFNFIFSKNIEHDKVLAFYKECQNNNFAFSHKAVMTQHNQTWLLNDLLKEIDEEHEFIQMYETLKQLLKDANTMDPEAYSEDTFKPYRNAFIKAFIYLKQEQLDKDTMQSLIQEVLNTKQELKEKDV